MASTAELSAAKLDRQFPGEKIQACALPGLELGYGPHITEDRLVEGVSWFLPANRRKWARDQASARANSFDWRNNKDHREKYSALIRKSSETTKEGQQTRLELNAYRQFEMLRDMYAMPFAMAAFQSINLSADELPLIINPKARQYFGVRYIGQDGGARQDQWREAKDIQQFEMRAISTDKIEFPLIDIQQGNVNRQTVINDQLRFDMEMKLDSLAQDQIDAAKTTSGLRDLLALHPLIIAANIPDKNYLDLTGTDPQVLTIAKWKTILSHVNSYGPGTDPDRSLTISTVIMSPQNVRDQWDYINLVSGFAGVGTVQPRDTVPIGVREDIFRTGMMNSAWGYTWNAIPNNRIPKGRLYVFMNQPLGWFFTKTEFDQLLLWDGPDQQEENLGQIVWKRVFQFVVPDLWKYRILIVDF